MIRIHFIIFCILWEYGFSQHPDYYRANLGSINDTVRLSAAMEVSKSMPN